MRTKEEIKEKASEYVDSVRNRIDSYAYLDVQEAFQKGAEWMQEQANGVDTSQDQALNLDSVSKVEQSGTTVCPHCGGEMINTKEYGWFCMSIECRMKRQTGC